ncbi:ATP-binding cassette domain-containing protein [Streptomyces sp. NPDC059015]|uniref:ATP-binding cassette domain-containing protein n=1 Tax=unclassified Streptomyces TaxID=2593676 RepID=UPI0036AC7F8F
METIDVLQLTKHYAGVRVVDRLTFTVRPGRVTGFLGPNGAGKSTTMRLVLGLGRPTSGSATIGGRAYGSLRAPLRHVGALLDAHAVHGSRSARNHLRSLAVANGLPDRRVEEVLDGAGLTETADRPVGEFSLGMRQRLGVAAALLGDPGVVMLDEPSNGLDPEGVVWIRGLLRRLAAEGRTVLVSSHLMSETAAFADHLVVLGRGRLLADMSIRTFLDAAGPPRVRLRTTQPARLLSALTRRGHSAESGEDGHVSVVGLRAEDVGILAAGEEIPVLELTDERLSLEEAYLRLTAADAQFVSGPPSTRQEV